MIKLLKYIAIVFGLSLSLIAVCYFVIEFTTARNIYKNLNQIPHNKVGVLLGTSAKMKSGSPNLYFKYRIEAAAELYFAGKIDYLIVSGDNSTKYYNEPEDMRKALVKKNIPNDRIYLDYAGFRTLDSVIRAKEIFGQKKFTIISQDFHNRRAIFIAKINGLEAVGYNAKNVTQKLGFKTNVREFFARVKVFIDLIFMKKPKFLGESIEIS